jgi:hypothetical protein
MASPSKAQIKANRQNAKRSTGPTSTQGKLNVSQNAITHGIFAASPLLPHENAKEFKALCMSVADVYPPVDAIAASLVERIILAIWRQKRLRIAEAARLEISTTPALIIEEVNDALGLSFPKRLDANSISKAQEQLYVYCKNLLEEFEELDMQAAPANLALISVKMPKIYAQLKHDAQNSEEPAAVFMSSPDKIIASLEHAKKKAMNCLAENEIKHKAYQMAQQMILAKLIPDGKRVDFLSKYQVQLDTDFYRAIEAFKKHMAWRAEHLEIDISVT